MIDTPIIVPYLDKSPKISEDVFIATGASIVGDVTIGNESSVWFGSVIRGDVQSVTIGNRSNIQDGSIIHVTRVTGPTIIGDDVTIGHGVILHACELHNLSFIGMGATVMDRVVVHEHSMVAAGALVTPGKEIPSGQLWGGSPAKYMRDLHDDEIAFIKTSADNYVRLSREYLQSS